MKIKVKINDSVYVVTIESCEEISLPKESLIVTPSEKKEVKSDSPPPIATETEKPKRGRPAGKKQTVTRDQLAQLALGWLKSAENEEEKTRRRTTVQEILKTRGGVEKLTTVPDDKITDVFTSLTETIEGGPNDTSIDDDGLL